MGPLNSLKRRYRQHDKIRDIVPEALKKDVDEALAETKKKNHLAALAIYKRIIPANPDIGGLRNNLGCCLAELEKFDEAETEFAEAIRITIFNRDKGIYVPRSYLSVPKRNLIKLYARQLPKNQLAHHYGLIKNNIRYFFKTVKRKGVIVALIKIPVYLYSKLNPKIRGQEKVISLRAEEFDKKNNIDTRGVLYETDLGMNLKNQAHARYYRGSDSLFFNKALSSLKINFNDYTFIDFGSGKGKALFLASAYSFKKIIGIEFSASLDATAQENIRQFKKDTIEAYCMDAVDYKIPDESIVCYFYDPFDEYIMTKVIGNIRRAHDSYRKDIIIVYSNSRLYNLFDAQDWLERKNYFWSTIIWSSKNNTPVA